MNFPEMSFENAQPCILPDQVSNRYIITTLTGTKPQVTNIYWGRERETPPRSSDNQSGGRNDYDRPSRIQASYIRDREETSDRRTQERQRKHLLQYAPWALQPGEQHRWWINDMPCRETDIRSEIERWIEHLDELDNKSAERLIRYHMFLIKIGQLDKNDVVYI